MVYRRFADRRTYHVTYKKFRNELNRCFMTLYLQLYVEVLTNPEPEVLSAYSNINHLIALFSTIFKVRATKLYNSNHKEEQLTLPQDDLEQPSSDEEILEEKIAAGQS